MLPCSAFSMGAGFKLRSSCLQGHFPVPPVTLFSLYLSTPNATVLFGDPYMPKKNLLNSELQRPQWRPQLHISRMETEVQGQKTQLSVFIGNPSCSVISCLESNFTQLAGQVGRNTFASFAEAPPEPLHAWHVVGYSVTIC